MRHSFGGGSDQYLSMSKKSSSGSAIATEILLDKIALLFESMKSSDGPSSVDFKLMRRYLSELQSGIEGWEAASVDGPEEVGSTHKRVEEVRVQQATPAPAAVQPSAAPEPPKPAAAELPAVPEPPVASTPAVPEPPVVESKPEASTPASGSDSQTKQSSDSGWSWGDPVKDKEESGETHVQESVAESDSAGSNQPDPVDETVEETSEAPESGSMEPAPGHAASPSENEERKESPVAAAPAVPEIQDSEPSLNDRFSSQSGSDVASATASVRNGLELRRLIDINERFLFTGQLFGGDSDAYRTAVRQLDEMPGFEAAESHALGQLGSKYNWDVEGKVVQHFLDILAQRYGVSR
jgi:hypothetical protein